MSDPQDHAEALDEDVVDTTDDRSGDAYGAGLTDFPPDQPKGVDAVGTTPIEEDGGESFAERDEQHRPDFGETPASSSSAERPDVAPERDAMHVERAPE